MVRVIFEVRLSVLFRILSFHIFSKSTRGLQHDYR